jgi:hypothetical protein
MPVFLRSRLAGSDGANSISPRGKVASSNSGASSPARERILKLMGFAGTLGARERLAIVCLYPGLGRLESTCVALPAMKSMERHVAEHSRWQTVCEALATRSVTAWAQRGFP